MLTKKYSYRRVVTEPDRQEIYKLRYEVYLKEGAIEKSSLEIFTDEFDNTGNFKLYGFYEYGLLIGSFRIHILKTETCISPARSVFPKEIGAYLAQGKTIIDPNRFTLKRGNNGNRERLINLMKIPFAVAQIYQADIVTATARREHMRLYKRLFYGVEVAEPKLYPTMLLPHGLMVSEFKRNELNILELVPEFRTASETMSELFDF